MSPRDAPRCLAHWGLPLLLSGAGRHVQVVREIKCLTRSVREHGIVQVGGGHGLGSEAEVLWWRCRRRLHLASWRQGSRSGRRFHVKQQLGTLIPRFQVAAVLIRIVPCQPAVAHGRGAGRRRPRDGVDGERVGREEIVVVIVGGGKVWGVEAPVEAGGGWEKGNIGPGRGLEVGLPARLDGGRLCQLAVAGIGPRDMAGKGLVGGRRHSVSFCRAGQGEVVIEGGYVGAFAVPCAPVAGADGVGEQGRLQGRAHQGSCGVWKVGGTGGGVGKDLAFCQAFASEGGLVLSELFFVLWLNHIERQVLPTPFGLELGQCKVALQAAGHL